MNPDQIIEACNTDDVSMIAEFVERASQHSQATRKKLLDTALRRAIKRDAIKIVAYVLDNGADFSKLDGSFITRSIDFTYKLPRRELVEKLIAHGWDINNGEVPLLWTIVDDRDWVEWCLNREAKVLPPPGTPGHAFTIRNPILQYPARKGDIATFELLRANGAPVSQAVLPSAVRAASKCAPQDGSESPSTEYKKLLTMVAHLLESVGIDANIPSFGAAAGVASGSFCSTPLCCVADSSKGETKELIWLLLDHGADPNLRGKYTSTNDPTTEHSVPSAMEAHPDNERFRKAVEDWMARRDDSHS